MGAIQVRRELRRKLALIERADEAKRYDVRNRSVLAAVGLAAMCGYPCGIRLDQSEPEWPVVYIELPEGQVSWHLPQHEREWDGHDTPEKYRRCRDFVARGNADE